MDDTPMVPLPELFAASDQQLRAAPHRHHSRGNLNAPEVARLRSSDNNADPDNCRICKDEATKDEPLFYPCKCSGSIKYVHQDCLMEWLSHSQKKHCELCKTPFRFTKLYSPQMPTTLPVHIFIGYVAKYLVTNVVVWLRGALVVTVWLCCLPGLMRCVWSLLFWLSDVGAGVGGPFCPAHDFSSTCTASPLVFASAATEGLGKILCICFGARHTAFWPGINISGNDSLSSAVTRTAAGSLANANTQLESTCLTAQALVTETHKSFLSDVSILQNLSRYPFVNRTIIFILEGQIITIPIIVGFNFVLCLLRGLVAQEVEINRRAALVEEDRLREQAGLDNIGLEAVDDADHVDAILELIGMRGPLVRLFYAVVFYARFVFNTIFIYVFVPYNLGRVSIWGAMNHSCLLSIVFGLTKFVQDVILFLTASACSGLLALMHHTGTAFGWWVPSGQMSCHALARHTWTIGGSTAMRGAGFARQLPPPLLDPSSWVINIGGSSAPTAVALDLASWPGTDRFWAILCGYTIICATWPHYLRRSTMFSILQGEQVTSGVMKVLLLVSIDRHVFPLYCGLLLDVALLPLFEGATMKSRQASMLNFPLTTIFVHWFVGTRYNFYVSLFLTMYSKIMRKGVFDCTSASNDSSFVRDILEGGATKSLRAFLFAAFLHGAFIMVCVGCVVWGLHLYLPSALPIHFLSNDSVLEFPIDLLVFNFSMSLAVRFFRPSDRLCTMYTWWSRKCARYLGLSLFLFGERRIDGEVLLALPNGLPHMARTWWRQFSTGLRKNNEVVPKDASVDAGAAEVYSSDQHHLPYVPPNFRSRIFTFALLLWIFSAVIGVGLTIVPLFFGRVISTLMIPAHTRINDVYAFSIGVHILGTTACLVFHARCIRETIARAATQALLPTRANDTGCWFGVGMWHAFKFCYTYPMLLILFPAILTFVTKLYLIIPMHTYLNPQGPCIVQGGVQSWILGLLYVKLVARVITSIYAGTRAASAVRAVLRRGWLRPDVEILTRAFVIPGLVLASIAIFGPAQVTTILQRSGMLGVPAPAPHDLMMIYLWSYPAAALSNIAAAILWRILRVFKSWENRARDDAYIIGVELHCFGVNTAGAGKNGGGRLDKTG